MRTVSFFVDKPVAMGARITPAIPTGRSSAVRAVFTVSDSKALTSAPGWRCSSRQCGWQLEIGNVVQIDRGYERIDERLRGLGARIDRVAVEPVPA